MDSSEEINFRYRGLSFISLPQIFKGNPPSTSISIFRRLGIRLNCASPCCVCVYLSAASSFFFFFFLLLFFLIETHVHVGHGIVSGSRALCTGATTSLTSKYFTGMCHTSKSHALFTGLTNFFFQQLFSLKMSLTALFTHLKIILLSCSQFSIFSF